MTEALAELGLDVDRRMRIAPYAREDGTVITRDDVGAVRIRVLGATKPMRSSSARSGAS